MLSVPTTQNNVNKENERKLWKVIDMFTALLAVMASCVHTCAKTCLKLLKLYMSDMYSTFTCQFYLTKDV